MNFLSRAMLLIVAAIHLLPLTGVLGAARLNALYGLDFSAPDMEILLRHRAVMFGLLGAFIAIAAFRAAWRRPALLAGWISVGSFLLLAALVGGYNAQVGRVVTADLIAAACLATGTFAEWRLAPARRT